MDIRQLGYLLAIVEADFNLSVASQKLNLSQPALSNIIKKIEFLENISLFHKYNGRLQGLTPSGEVLYKHAQIIVNQHQAMLTELQASTGTHKGRIRIGLAPLVLASTFAGVLEQLRNDYPDVNIEIIEKGAHDLHRMFVGEQLDLVSLISFLPVDPKTASIYSLQTGTLNAYVSKSHPLANHPRLRWKDLEVYPVALFDESFTLHHIIMEQFNRAKIEPKIQFTSAHWDYLLFSTKNSQLVTIWPSPIDNIVPKEHFSIVPFDEPVPWEVTLCYRKKKVKNALEQLVVDRMIEYFQAEKIQ